MATLYGKLEKFELVILSLTLFFPILLFFVSSSAEIFLPPNLGDMITWVSGWAIPISLILYWLTLVCSSLAVFFGSSEPRAKEVAATKLVLAVIFLILAFAALNPKIVFEDPNRDMGDFSGFLLVTAYLSLIIYFLLNYFHRIILFFERKPRWGFALIFILILILGIYSLGTTMGLLEKMRQLRWDCGI